VTLVLPRVTLLPLILIFILFYFTKPTQLRNHMNTIHPKITLTTTAQLSDITKQLQLAPKTLTQYLFFCPHCTKYYTSSHNSANNCTKHPSRASNLNTPSAMPLLTHLGSPSTHTPLPRAPQSSALAVQSSATFCYPKVAHIIPLELHPHLTSILYLVLHNINESIANGRDQVAEQAIIHLLDLPALLLRCKRGGTHSNDIKRTVATLLKTLRNTPTHT
jgi:hypothetical protein